MIRPTQWRTPGTELNTDKVHTQAFLVLEIVRVPEQVGSCREVIISPRGPNCTANGKHCGVVPVDITRVETADSREKARLAPPTHTASEGRENREMQNAEGPT